jgi:hypothetical protein
MISPNSDVFESMKSVESVAFLVFSPQQQRHGFHGFHRFFSCGPWPRRVFRGLKKKYCSKQNASKAVTLTWRIELNGGIPLMSGT